MTVECICSLSFRKTIYCFNTLYDCVVWLFKIIRHFKQNWDSYSKTYTFYCKVLGYSIMWVYHFKYLLHNWTWLNTFHIQRISRPIVAKGQEPGILQLAEVPTCMLLPTMHFCGLHLFCQCRVLLRVSELWQPLCFVHHNQKSL